MYRNDISNNGHKPCVLYISFLFLFAFNTMDNALLFSCVPETNQQLTYQLSTFSIRIIVFVQSISQLFIFNIFSFVIVKYF